MESLFVTLKEICGIRFFQIIVSAVWFQLDRLLEGIQGMIVIPNDTVGRQVGTGDASKGCSSRLFSCISQLGPLQQLAERLSQMIEWRHEGIFTRHERTRPSCSRRRKTARANYRTLSCLASDDRS